MILEDFGPQIERTFPPVRQSRRSRRSKCPLELDTGPSCREGNRPYTAVNRLRYVSPSLRSINKYLPPSTVVQLHIIIDRRGLLDATSTVNSRRPSLDYVQVVCAQHDTPLFLAHLEPQAWLAWLQATPRYVPEIEQHSMRKRSSASTVLAIPTSCTQRA